MVRTYSRSWTFVRAVLLTVLALSVAPLMIAQGSPCGPIDLVFVIDSTGSMQGTLDNIAADLSNVVNTVNRASGGDYRLGLVDFNDDVIVLNDLSGANTASVVENLRNLNADGGGNEPEASDEALNTVINGLDAADRAATQQIGDFKGRFREDATKIIILVTDARPAGFDDAYTEGVDDVIAFNHALTANEKEIRISSIYVPTPFAVSQEGNEEIITRVLRRYASTTGGRFAQSNGDGSGTSLGITNVINSCGGSTFFLAATPEVIELAENQSARFNVNLTPIGRFDSAITLSIGNLPEGATYSFSPASVPAPGSGSSILTFTPGPSTPPGVYNLEILGTTADGLTTRSATVRVLIDCRPPFVYGTEEYMPTSQVVRSGRTATLRVIPGGTAPFTYQWYEGASANILFPVAGATGSTFVTPPLTQKTEYWVRVTNGCGSYDSWTSTLTIGTPSGSSESTRTLRRR